MSKSIDVATATIHLQGVGRVPAVEARELKVGDQLMYNYGGVYQITKIEDASPKFFRIFEVSAETGEEHSSRVKKDRLVARVHEADRRRLGHDAPATVYRAQVYAPHGRTWITVSHGATVEAAASGRTRLNQFSYFASVLLDRHGLGGTFEARAASVKTMAQGKTLTTEDGHSFRILPPEPTSSKSTAPTRPCPSPAPSAHGTPSASPAPRPSRSPPTWPPATPAATSPAAGWATYCSSPPTPACAPTRAARDASSNPTPRAATGSAACGRGRTGAPEEDDPTS